MRAALLVLVLLAAPAGAQAPDSLQAQAAPADSLAPLPPRPAVGPFGPAAGRPITSVPAVTASLDVAGLVAQRPEAFGYALGAPGRTAGVSLDGLDPDAYALSLDGRPLTDPVTDAPRADLLPLGALGPVRRGGDGWGRAVALGAGLRAFRLAVPITELRYLGGQDGVRHASGTHAQTRRPPAFLRGGSDDARLTATLHAASRAAAGPLAGATLRHTDAVGRLLLTRPGVAAETGVLYTDRTEGARAGVVSDIPADDGVFEFATATAREPGALRRTIRTEGWLRLRVPVTGRPLEAGVSGVVQRGVYTSAGRPGTRVHARRLTGFAEQPFAVGGHRLAARLDAVFDAAPDTAAGGFQGVGPRLGLHASVADSVRLGGVSVVLAGGAHQVGGEAWPSAGARVERGAWSAGVRVGGRARPRVAESGLSRILASADGPTTRIATADAALAVRRADWRLGLRAFASAERDGWHLAARSDSTFAFESLASLTQGGLSAEVGWREATRRGFYASVQATARAVSDPAGGLRQRVDAALPRLWGATRVGVRAEDVGDGVLDLDLAAVGRGWTAFRSRLVDPATGLLVLPLAGDALGVELPARGTLGLEATATFSAQTSLFVRYDHALGNRLYDGAIVTQGEPLAPHVLRFGVFWALLN